MNKVIGYFGTPEDRYAKWLTMLMLKASRTVFAGTQDEKEIKVRDQDERIYKDTLKEYSVAA